MVCYAVFGSGLVTDILSIFCHCIYACSYLYFCVPMVFSCIPSHAQLPCVLFALLDVILYKRCYV